MQLAVPRVVLGTTKLLAQPSPNRWKAANRGYQIEARREWSNWCVNVYRTRPTYRSCRNQLCIL